MESATEAEIQRARDEYGDDDLEIDDDAKASRSVDGSGVWVAAWVYLSNESGVQS